MGGLKGNLSETAAQSVLQNWSPGLFRVAWPFATQTTETTNVHRCRRTCPTCCSPPHIKSEVSCTSTWIMSVSYVSTVSGMPGEANLRLNFIAAVVAALSSEQRGGRQRRAIYSSTTTTMASVRSATKAFTLPPTVRTLPSGVPVAKYINLNARAPADEHGHGHDSVPRSDRPSKWAAGIQLSSGGLSTKTFTTGALRSSL